MFYFDDNFIFTWEFINGRPIRPVVLSIIKSTGQIIGRPINKTIFYHVGVVLGYRLDLKELYVCSFTRSGIEIASIQHFRGTHYGESHLFITGDEKISIKKSLQRLENFFADPHVNYCIGHKNCQWFAFNIAYGEDKFSWVRDGLTLLIFVLLFNLLYDLLFE